MGFEVTHKFISSKSEQTDPTIVGPNEWNAIHAVSTLGYAITVPDFNFTPQEPGGSLNIGSNTITLSPMPSGISSDSVGQAWVSGPYKHFLYISGGTGTAEAVPITGWTSNSVTVLCANTHSGSWTIQSASGGLQETINYAWANALAVGYYGSAFNKDNTKQTMISIFGPVYVPPGWGNVIDLHGVNIWIQITSAWASGDAFTFDTFDFCTYHIGNQIGWPNQQNGSAIFRFQPMNANGESATGMFTSTIRFGVIVPAQSNGSPGPYGYCIRLTPTTSGQISGVNFSWDQLNSGQYGVYIDNPVNGSNGVGGNTFCGYVNSQTVAAAQIGTSATTYIDGNYWNLKGYAGGTALVITYAINDYFNLILNGGSGDGIQLKSGSQNNLVIAPAMPVGGTPFNNAGVGNRFFTSGPTITASPTVSGSPFVYQNLTGRVLAVLVSSSTITSIGTSVDGVSYTLQDSPATNTNITLIPNQYLQVVYTGSAPSIIVYY